MTQPGAATPRWTPLRPHAIQAGYWNSPHRFNVVPAGRRSGKTEFAKRRVVRAATTYDQDRPGYFFCAAPTYGQAKRIYWEDLKAMVPPAFLGGRIKESELKIPLWHGGFIQVLGLDQPARIEGSPWDGGVIDEIANVKGEAWGANVRPALSDRQGWCDLIGVPEGRNHYYDMAEKAQERLQRDGRASEWGYFHWKSADILPASEIAAAKDDLDELTYLQEYEASFVNFSGRAYYNFDLLLNCGPMPYGEWKPLNLCFDFNVDPGVCVIVQEVCVPGVFEGTAVIGEVHIERNSNTPAVCRKIIADWGNHKGKVRLFGDATGGSRGTAKVAGSDWDIIWDMLKPVFGDQLQSMVPKENPPERVRVNAMNSRICSISGIRRLMVDRSKAKNTVRDLDGVRVLPGSDGELDKHTDKRLTHLSDALGYYVVSEFPITDRGGSSIIRVTGV